MDNIGPFYGNNELINKNYNSFERSVTTPKNEDSFEMYIKKEKEEKKYIQSKFLEGLERQIQEKKD